PAPERRDRRRLVDVEERLDWDVPRPPGLAAHALPQCGRDEPVRRANAAPADAVLEEAGDRQRGRAARECGARPSAALPEHPACRERGRAGRRRHASEQRREAERLQRRIRAATSWEQPAFTSSTAWWRSTSFRAASRRAR